MERPNHLRPDQFSGGSALRSLLFGSLAALALLIGTAAQGAASEVGTGSLYLDGRVVGTVLPPAHVPPGTGRDPFYKVTNGAAGQLGIAGVGPGDDGYHGGDWEVFTVTFKPGVTPTLLTSGAAVLAAESAGRVTVTRVPSADFRCPVTQQA
jgi:hypothetical protein